MAASLLEQEIGRRLTGLRQRLIRYDRVVLIGFLFSLLPIFPLALGGLGLGLFHRSMYRTGRLDDFNYALARRGLVFGSINSAISLGILYAVIRFVFSVDWEAAASHLPQALSGLWRFFDHIHQPAPRPKVLI